MSLAHSEGIPKRHVLMFLGHCGNWDKIFSFSAQYSATFIPHFGCAWACVHHHLSHALRHGIHVNLGIGLSPLVSFSILIIMQLRYYPNIDLCVNVFHFMWRTLMWLSKLWTHVLLSLSVPFFSSMCTSRYSSISHLANHFHMLDPASEEIIFCGFSVVSAFTFLVGLGSLFWGIVLASKYTCHLIEEHKNLLAFCQFLEALQNMGLCS